MTIPYKAMPDVPGAVIRFNETMGYSDMAQRDIVLSAFALLNTALAVEALGYDTMPSVLIIGADSYSVDIEGEIRQVSDAYVDHDSDGFVRGVVSSEFAYRVYGNKPVKKYATMPKAAGFGEGPPETTISDEDFLKDIIVHEPTGIHTFYVKSSQRVATHVKQVQMAQKYFDIVLVDYTTLKTLNKEKSVTVLEYLLPRQKVSYTRSLPVRIYHDLLSGTKKKTWGKGAFSIQNPHDNNDLGLLMVSSILLAALAPGKEEQYLWSELNEVKPSFKDKFSSAIATSGDRGVQAVLGTGGGLGLLGAGAIAVASLFSLDPDTAESILSFAGWTASFGAANIVGATSLAIVDERASKKAATYDKKFLEQNPYLSVSKSNELLPLSASPVLLTAGIESKDSSENLITVSQTGSVSSGLPSISQSKPDEASEKVQKIVDAPPLSKVVLSKRLGKLTDKWMTYELDPMKSLDYPLMLDASCPQTRRFLNAIHHAASLEEELGSGEVSIVEFQQAVLEAEDAFFEAEGHAKKMRYAHLDAEQKKKIRDARPLVALLDDEDASPHEKVSAYRKAGDFLEGIIALPERPIMGLLEVSRV